MHSTMDQSKQCTSLLFMTSCIESKDEWEEKYERAHSTLQSLVSGLSEKETHDALNSAIGKDAKTYEEISIGLMVCILTEPKNAPKNYRDMSFISRDGLSVVLNNLTQLIMEKYLRLQEVVQKQIIWLVREMIRNSIANVDVLCWNLMRQVAGGDITPRNIWLADSLLDIFVENRTWLDKFPFLVASVAYTYLRLIEDHFCVALEKLRQKEVNFVVLLLREKFSECLVIGRDLVRLLQNIARIPEIEKLWKDLLFKPTVLCANFTGLLQLLQMRTSRRFLQSRLTPDMEKKLVFFTSQVRFRDHKRYQDWFQRQYLATPESQSLRCDLIRFIVGVIHPTNELLCSDIIPRWAVIGWLLTTCTSTAARANTKLALFYDWLFYNPEKDNIMNIEPGILVMHHSMKPHLAITATLLDFLCRIIPNYYPPLTDMVRSGVFNSLRQILEKRVLPSLTPLFDNSKLDKELRNNIRETFGEFFLQNNDGKLEDGKDIDKMNDVMFVDNVELSTTNNHLPDVEPVFSDEEEDLPIAKVKMKENKEKEEKKEKKKKEEEEDRLIVLSDGMKDELSDKPTITTRLCPDLASNGEVCELDQLREEVRLLVEMLQNEVELEERCVAVNKFVQAVEDDDVDESLASCLCYILRDELEGKVFPEEPNEESIEDSISRPLYVLFRNLVEISEMNPTRRLILCLLVEMQIKQPRLGYHLLYYLKASKSSEGKLTVYQDFASELEKSLDTCLIDDMKTCMEDDVNLFFWLVPEIFTQFPEVTVGNIEFMNLVVLCMDSLQLQELVCHMMQGNLVMFAKDSFLKVLTASLEWETFEQYCLWQLISAQNMTLDSILPIISKLDYTSHAEAITSIMLMLKLEKPNMDLLRPLLGREVKHHDFFATSILNFWSQEYEEELSDLLSHQLQKYNASPQKRKRNQASRVQPGMEQMLLHLDHFRQCCRQTNFFSLTNMQHALQQVRKACTETQKKKFCDLFALADAEEEVKPSRNSRSRKAKGRGRANKEVSESSETSSEEEDIKARPKKRRRNNPVGSDSD